jgi:hypothetical protein
MRQREVRELKFDKCLFGHEEEADSTEEAGRSIDLESHLPMLSLFTLLVVGEGVGLLLLLSEATALLTCTGR